MITDQNLYETGTLTSSDLSALQDSFDHLPPDPYAESRLRSRRYSRFLYQDGTITRQSHKEFMQSSEINDAVGDVEREYEEVEDTLLTNPALLEIFEEFKTRTGINDQAVIEMHQIRWHCRGRVKRAAPEGRHQDGFDYIGMFMVDTDNVDGGEIMVYNNKDTPPIFKKALANGEFCVMNDRALFHNAAPLVPTANDDDGHWDLIVLTANA